MPPPPSSRSELSPQPASLLLPPSKRKRVNCSHFQCLDSFSLMLSMSMCYQCFDCFSLMLSMSICYQCFDWFSLMLSMSMCYQCLDSFSPISQQLTQQLFNDISLIINFRVNTNLVPFIFVQAHAQQPVWMIIYYYIYNLLFITAQQPVWISLYLYIWADFSTGLDIVCGCEFLFLFV